MKSHYITDQDGHRLRSTYFPFDLEKTKPPSASGFMLHSEKVELPRAASSPMISRQPPSTFMVVDYNQDRQQLHTMVEKNFSPEPLLPPATRSAIRRRLSIKPIDAKKPVSHPAQSLRSSFILKSKLQNIGLDPDVSVSQQLFNKCDQGTQTNNDLYRLNFKGLTDYNEWSNSVAEPFFKVRVSLSLSLSLSFSSESIILQLFCI